MTNTKAIIGHGRRVRLVCDVFATEEAGTLILPDGRFTREGTYGTWTIVREDWSRYRNDGRLYTEALDVLTGEDEGECPACGEYIQYCQGHGEIGDPDGAAILAAHDEGDHSQCAIEDCD